MMLVISVTITVDKIFFPTLFHDPIMINTTNTHEESETENSVIFVKNFLGKSLWKAEIPASTSVFHTGIILVSLGSHLKTL